MVTQRTSAKRPRRGRGSLDAEAVIAGAFELADEVSIDNLSMPMLAKHLGVGVTNIYWYFKRKDDLLNAMTERALLKYDFAAPFVDASDWRESLREHAHTMRARFLNDHILCDLVLIRSALSPKAAQLGSLPIETAVEALIGAGLSLDDAFDTYSAIQLHIRGSVVLSRLQEKQKVTDPEAHAYYEDLVITPERTPRLAEAIGRGHSVGAPDAKNFEYGLDCIIDHASMLILANQMTAKSRKRATKTPARAARPKKSAAR